MLLVLLLDWYPASLVFDFTLVPYIKVFGNSVRTGQVCKYNTRLQDLGIKIDTMEQA